MRRRLFVLLVPFSMSLLAMPGCGDDEPADTEGDAPGECSDEADNDRDGRFDCDDPDCSGSPACRCTDECGPEGIRVCEGDVARSCEPSAGGCLGLVDEDCTATGMQCVGGACVVPAGLCTVTGIPCTGDEDCPATEITGFCIDGPGWYCGYDTRLDTASTVTCEAKTVGRCETSTDCPAEPGVSCASLAANHCGAIADGICVVSKASCSADSECSSTPANTCATCGDGVTIAPAEECDDGNTTDDDGCSSDCHFEGVCITRITHQVVGCGCSTYADCNGDACMQCALEGCSCGRP